MPSRSATATADGQGQLNSIAHRDHAMARRIADFIIYSGRDCDGWQTDLREIVDRFPHASLRAYLWALERVS
jgi:hypothetical protein